MSKLAALKAKLKALDKKMTKKKMYIYFSKPKIDAVALIKDRDLHIYLNIS